MTKSLPMVSFLLGISLSAFQFIYNCIPDGKHEEKAIAACTQHINPEASPAEYDLHGVSENRKTEERTITVPCWLS